LCRIEIQFGHGTFLASIAAGRPTGEYIGVAPDSEIIAVKLRKAKQYYLDTYLVVPTEENVYETTDFVLAVEYMMQKAASLNRPISICVGLGTNLTRS
jgi:tRNA G46 methylase TrmB